MNQTIPGCHRLSIFWWAQAGRPIFGKILTASDQSGSQRPIAMRASRADGLDIGPLRRAAACTQMRSPPTLLSCHLVGVLASAWGTSLPLLKPPLRWPCFCGGSSTMVPPPLWSLPLRVRSTCSSWVIVKLWHMVRWQSDGKQDLAMQSCLHLPTNASFQEQASFFSSQDWHRVLGSWLASGLLASLSKSLPSTTSCLFPTSKALPATLNVPVSNKSPKSVIWNQHGQTFPRCHPGGMTHSEFL